MDSQILTIIIIFKKKLHMVLREGRGGGYDKGFLTVQQS